MMSTTRMTTRIAARTITARTIAPRIKTRTMQTDPLPHDLPDALLTEHVQRVALTAIVAAGLWSYGLAMDTLVRPATLHIPIPPSSIIIELVSMALAGLMFVYVRYSSHPAHVKSDAGLLFFVLNAAAVALLNHWTHAPGNEYARQLSWTTVVILIASMIIPTTPSRMLITATLAASMDPLAVWLAHLRGMATPSPLATLVLFMPNYACAVVSVLPSRVLRKLGRSLRQGRGVAGTASAAGAQRRDQAGAAGAARRQQRCGNRRHAPPLRARSTGHRGAELTAHDPALRLRHHRRSHVLLRDGAARRARPRDAGAGVRPDRR
jgi:hypothetical protein